MANLSYSLVSKALELGATVAGIASLDEILSTPAHVHVPLRKDADPGQAVLVIALHHPPWQPELDPFTGRGGTEGNRTLIRINKGLIGWLEEDHGIKAADLPYYTEHGGVYLKDAAVLAGLGAVGVSNLMMVPGCGPYVRFRGLLVKANLPSASQVEYSPCEGCERPCLEACPEGALTVEWFDRDACLGCMSKEGAGDLVMDPCSVPSNGVVQFCRQCEMACPVGATSGVSL